MEQRLKEIIARIEASSLSEQEKAQLYTALSGGLQASVWPTLMQYVPEGEIDTLLVEPDGQKRVARYSQIIADVVDKGNTLSEIEETMNKLLDEVDAVLKEEHI